jgi:NAD(P)-dependent dehydrogenase (short-subunit alcohol dehydrogenase family)
MIIPETVAFVTGAASGLGAAIASELGSAGARVLCFDTAFVDETRSGSRIERPGNVSEESSVGTALDLCETHFGRPAQILVNCAGVALPGQRLAGHRGPISLDSFRKIIDINLTGSFNVMRMGAQQMIGMEVDDGVERGVIINVSSINAEDGPVGTLPYSCSKAAVAGMTLPAARDLGPFGIRVNCILPGTIDTPMLRNMPDEAIDYVVSKNPFPKRPGHPDEFASLAMEIIGNTAINGSNFRIDCGVRLAFEK